MTEQAMTDFKSLPPITLTFGDRQRLERLAEANLARFPQTADYLAREVERAQIAQPDCPGGQFVSVGSRVEFRDDATGRVHRVTLVYPEWADVSARRISVLTPVGAALVGLSKDQSIEWQTPSGEWRSLTVLAVGVPIAAGPE
jgi:regulator of nucleoside diphosphate kinase